MNMRNILVLLIFIIIVFGIIYYLGYQSKTYGNGNILKLVIYNPTNCTVFSPFQQEIYINSSLMNEYGINENGSNVFFFTNLSNITRSILSSWFAGYYNNYSIWWVRLPSSIPPYSNITIYMYIGPKEENYYEEYSPYVGISSYVYNNYNWGLLSIYDNGQFVFDFYGWFYDTKDNWVLNIENGNYSPTINGIEMLNYSSSQGSYIEPPNNGNIPEIPLIVEEAWYYNGEADANVISMYGGKSVVYAAGANKFGGATPTLYNSIFAQYEYYFLHPRLYISYIGDLGNIQLYKGPFIYKNQSYIYSYFLVDFCNDSNAYAQAGYLVLNNTPSISLLGTLESTNRTLKIEIDRNMLSGDYFSIGSGDGSVSTSSQSIYWVVGRTYPPYGIMPEVYIENLS